MLDDSKYAKWPLTPSCLQHLSMYSYYLHLDFASYARIAHACIILEILSLCVTTLDRLDKAVFHSNTLRFFVLVVYLYFSCALNYFRPSISSGLMLRLRHKPCAVFTSDSVTYRSRCLPCKIVNLYCCYL